MSLSTAYSSLAKKLQEDIPFRVGFVGCGKVGSKILTEVLKSDMIHPGRIQVACRQPQNLGWFSDRGVKVHTDNRRLAKECMLVFICCLPHQVQTVAKSIVPSKLAVGKPLTSSNVPHGLPAPAPSPSPPNGSPSASPPADSYTLQSATSQFPSSPGIRGSPLLPHSPFRSPSQRIRKVASYSRPKPKVSQAKTKPEPNDPPSLFVSILNSVTDQKLKSLLDTQAVATTKIVCSNHYKQVSHCAFMRIYVIYSLFFPLMLLQLSISHSTRSAADVHY